MTTFIYDSTTKFDWKNTSTFAFYYSLKDDVDSDSKYVHYDLISDGDAALFGVGLKDKLGELTSGKVTDIVVHSYRGTMNIADFSYDARALGALMKKNNAASNEKIFKVLFEGDDEIVLGLSNDVVKSFGGDDFIYGRSGNDTIDAGDGDDTLFGGVGNDTLTGGKGSDYFVFDTKPSSKNIDKITDFSLRDDMIVLDHLVFRKVGKAGALADTAFYVSSSGRAHDADDRIIYNKSSGSLIYDADGNRSGEGVVFAKISAGLKLTSDHFDII